MKGKHVNWWLWLGLVTILLAFFAPATISHAGRLEREIEGPRCVLPVQP
jgi:hypothetical protein